MNLDNFALEAFINVVEKESFTKASEYIGRTQSAVSQQIAKIEALLGKPLLIRGKNIALTPEGETFYTYAKQIYDLQKQAIQHFKSPSVKGEVKFGLPEDFITIFLDSVLSEFTRHHPNITINIECDLSLNLLERFKNHEFDMILLKVNQAQDVPNSLEVWSEQLEWVGSKMFSNKQDLTQDLPLVLSPPPCLYRLRAIESLEEKNIKSRIVFTSSSYNSKIAAVKAGLGITVLPRSMVPNQLHILNDSRLPKLDDTHISLLKHDEKNTLISSFGDFIMKKLKH